MNYKQEVLTNSDELYKMCDSCPTPLTDQEIKRGYTTCNKCISSLSSGLEGNRSDGWQDDVIFS